MRRRIVRRDPTAEVPSRLLTFDPDDWPDGPLVDDVERAWEVGGVALVERRIRELIDPAERRLDRTYHRWRQARAAWADAHGWPDGDGIDLLTDADVQFKAWCAAHGLRDET